jgi:hypothetical protein
LTDKDCWECTFFGAQVFGEFVEEEEVSFSARNAKNYAVIEALSNISEDLLGCCALFATVPEEKDACVALVEDALDSLIVEVEHIRKGFILQEFELMDSAFDVLPDCR